MRRTGSPIRFWMLLLALSPLWVLPAAAAGADGTFDITVDKTLVTMGDYITMTIEIVSAERFDSLNLDDEHLPDFEVTPGGTQSFSVQRGGPGRMRTVFQLTQTFILSPLKAGKLTIPSLTVELPDGELRLQSQCAHRN